MLARVNLKKIITISFSNRSHWRKLLAFVLLNSTNICVTYLIYWTLDRETCYWHLNRIGLLKILLMWLKEHSQVWEFSVIESVFKIMKNAFYFTLQALFVLKVFKFLSLWRHILGKKELHYTYCPISQKVNVTIRLNLAS